MSPLRAFSAHIATPQQKAILPTWTRPAPGADPDGAAQGRVPVPQPTLGA
jgi:hypothetical protein